MADKTISIKIKKEDHEHAVAAFADAYDYDKNALTDENIDQFAVRKTKEYILEIANNYSKKIIDTKASDDYKLVKKDKI